MLGSDSEAAIKAGLMALAARSEVMARLIDRHGPYTPRRDPHPDVFASLARAIIYQQLAGKAAATIHGRFEALVDGGLTADKVLSLPVERLRSAGLSGAKQAAVRDLAHHVTRGELELQSLDIMDDAELTRSVCRVRGIGPWTAQMFLIFQLGRLDVWPTGDLGVRKGYARAFGTDMPDAKSLAPLGDPFKPYRSMVAWYCWRATDAGP